MQVRPDRGGAVSGQGARSADNNTGGTNGINVRWTRQSPEPEPRTNGRSLTGILRRAGEGIRSAIRGNPARPSDRNQSEETAPLLPRHGSSSDVNAPSNQPPHVLPRVQMVQPSSPALTLPVLPSANESTCVIST